MKTKILLVMLAFLSLSNFYAQVGIDTTTPDNSRISKVKAMSKGLLLSKMSTADRDTISSPAEGLVIYNTDEKRIQWYNGSVWFDAFGFNEERAARIDYLIPIALIIGTYIGIKKLRK